MSWPLFEDDRGEAGLIDASTLHARRHGSIPPVAVLCFFNDLLGELAATGVLREVATLRSEIGRNPVYQLDHPAGPLTVVHPGVGAPLAAGVVEELRGYGVRTFVACGGAGALRGELDLGHVVIVDSALRDEGTSFHYAAPSRVLDADPLGVAVLRQLLDEQAIAYEVGRTWTTDAFFRETRSRIARRVAEGCHVVDMESSAFLAVAAFYGLRFAQLLYAGDSVAGDDWDSRHWDRAQDHRARLFELAAEAAWRLERAPTPSPATHR